MTQELTVIVHRQGVEAIEAQHQSMALPGEPEDELLPTSLAEKLSGKAIGNHRVERRSKGQEGESS